MTVTLKVQKSPLSQAILLGLTTLMASSLLVGCGSSDDRKESANHSGDHGHDHDHDHDHDHKVEESVVQEVAKGRLFITEADSSKAHIFSIAQNKVIQTIDLGADAEVNGLVNSPEGKYAILLDRTNHKVSFYHSGLTVEDHGDHDHPYAKDSEKLSMELGYTKPVHYQTNGEYSGLFFDGKGKADNPVDDFEKQAGFVLLSDEMIAKKEFPYQKLNTNMHGTAEPRGDDDHVHVLSVARNTAGTSLPETIELYHLHGDKFEKEKTFESKCPGLHGSASSGEHSVFACSDGVVIIDQESDEVFKDAHVANPDVVSNMTCEHHGKSRPARFGSVLANNHEHNFVGFACGKPFAINPETKSISEIVWTTDSTAKVASYQFDAHGKNLLLLDKQGKLHVLDVEQGYKPVNTLNVFPEGVSASGHHGPQLLVNPNTDLVYMADEEHKKLIPLDIEKGKVLDAVSLGFAPEKFTWFGVMNHHDHDEHKDHSH